MIIAGITSKIKSVGKSLLLFIAHRDTLLAIILFGVATASFVIGLKSAKDIPSGPKIIFTKVDIPQKIDNKIEGDAGEQSQEEVTDIFASRNGTKYYYAWCSSASRIKPYNRVYYSTKEEAIASGKTIASNCRE
jgi:hypothetical protein